MAAISIQFAAQNAVQTVSGKLLVNFADGTQLEFDDADGLRQYVVANGPGRDAVRAMAVANRLARDPGLNSIPAQWDGKTFTLDLEAASPGNIVKVV